MLPFPQCRSVPPQSHGSPVANAQIDYVRRPGDRRLLLGVHRVVALKRVDPWGARDRLEFVPTRIEALLFDLGRVVIDLDQARAHARLAALAGMPTSDIASWLGMGSWAERPIAGRSGEIAIVRWPRTLTLARKALSGSSMSQTPGMVQVRDVGWRRSTGAAPNPGPRGSRD
jgi:hypothetical protein